ncbi:MAG: deoxyguanosinetriphosphate triphosphohydrolase [Lachnospiraceae bacterium]|nr:deoxyguanosinetriphosphate triphosphohydrolase [Lachnospiraceae bacterium]
MTIREELEQREREILAPWASLSAESRGRERDEIPCDIRPAFQRDRDRILHSKSFRRLKDKTQVFLAPFGDHYRTRMTHTLEVSQNARTIAKALRLNEDLVEAIALGHDLGHTPFGHAGERALDRVCPLGFSHNVQSLRLVDVLERDGKGLNLSWEVRDGILNHQTSGSPSTLEGRIVRLSDKIAYFHHDMDDAMRAGILTEEDVPEEITSVVGKTTGERLDHFIHDLIRTSQGKPVIAMSPPVAQAMKDMRAFMHRRVYADPVAKAEEHKAERVVEVLYGYYLEHTEDLPAFLREMVVDDTSKHREVCDYISAMSDRFAIAKYEELFIPKSWSVL